MSAPSEAEPQLLGSELIFEGRIFRLLRERVRLPSGLEQTLELVAHPGAVAIAAQDRAGRLLLVRQYRHAVGAWLTEVPAGRLEPGEQALRGAMRELEEETGHRAGAWRELRAIVPAPGFCSERIRIFHARELEPVRSGALAPDADEEIELCWASPAEVLASGIEDAKTLVAAALLLRARGG